MKRDGSSVRICGDFKLSINPVSSLDSYPIPKVKDLFSTLSGGKVFTKLDLQQAYQQLELDENSKQYVVINTHRGLFWYNRLPLGVWSATGIFQPTMENLLQDILKAVVYLDDILLTGSSEEEHLYTLQSILHRLESASLKLRRDKCKFLTSSITYLGHRIESEGFILFQARWMLF